MLHRLIAICLLIGLSSPVHAEYAVVPNSAPNGASNTISIIDLATFDRAVPDLAVPGPGTSLGYVAITPNSQKAVIGDIGNNRLFFVDLSSKTLDPTTIALTYRPVQFAITSDGTKALIVSNSVGINKIEVANLQNMTVSQVTLTDGVNTATNPSRITLNQAGTVAAVITSDAVADYVAVIDLTQTPPVCQRLISMGVGTGPMDIAITSNGKLAAVTNRPINSVRIVDLTGVNPQTVKPVNGAWSIGITPDQHYAVGCSISDWDGVTPPGPNFFQTGQVFKIDLTNPTYPCDIFDSPTTNGAGFTAFAIASNSLIITASYRGVPTNGFPTIPPHALFVNLNATGTLPSVSNTYALNENDFCYTSIAISSDGKTAALACNRSRLIRFYDIEHQTDLNKSIALPGPINFAGLPYWYVAIRPEYPAPIAPAASLTLSSSTNASLLQSVIVNTLAWNAPTSIVAVKYTIHRTDQGALSMVKNFEVSGSSLTFQDSNQLLPSTVYDYVVTAVDVTGATEQVGAGSIMSSH
jgi:hypothetical protein